MNRFLPPHIQFSQRYQKHCEINLSDSCAESLTMQELLALSNESITDTKLTYASVLGDAVLRQEIVALHNADKYGCNEEQVLTFCGAQEAIAACYQAVLEADDEVILCSPYYPSLYSMIAACGALPRLVPLTFECQWRIDLEQIISAISERTKLVVINSPHNPTGASFEPEILSELITVLSAKSIYLLIDDVAAFSNGQGRSDLSAALAYERTIVVSVLSKSFGLAGIRIGWAITPNRLLLSTMLKTKTLGSICTSIVDEQLAIIALKNKEKILTKNQRIIENNKSLFSQLVESTGELDWHPPSQGILTTVKVNSAQCAERWSIDLVKQTGLLLLPCSLFGLEGPYVRLGLGKKVFSKGVKRLNQYLGSA